MEIKKKKKKNSGGKYYKIWEGAWKKFGGIKRLIYGSIGR